MVHSITQFVIVSAVTIGVGIATAGIGAILGTASCLLGLPPAARMLLKCSCDMILILERSFRYEGKYVSVKQIEDAARYYTTTTIKTFAGKEKRLQQQVHDEIDSLIPLKKMHIGFRFNKLRDSIEDLIYASRFGKPPDYPASPISSTESPRSSRPLVELPEAPRPPVELENTSFVPELEGDVAPMSHSRVLKGDTEKVLGSLNNMSLRPAAGSPGGMLSAKTAELQARLSPQSAASGFDGSTLIGDPGEDFGGSMANSVASSESNSRSKWRPSWLRSKKSKNAL
jgi:hypothetical protein